MAGMASSASFSLTDSELHRAIGLWNLGKDTCDIANMLSDERVGEPAVHESAVFNALRAWREARRTAA